MADGKLSIHRVTSNARADYIGIVVTCEGVRLQVYLDMAPFALAVTGQEGQPCEVYLSHKPKGP